jgi:hypothetical protein
MDFYVLLIRTYALLMFFRHELAQILRPNNTNDDLIFVKFVSFVSKCVSLADEEILPMN